MRFLTRSLPLLLIGAARISAAPSLAQLDPATFQNPPPDARPMTWMHMMNGNASEAGLLKDLQALADAGVGGALIFSISSPDIPEGKVRFNSPEFRSILVSGAKEAERLGLKLGVHNCDGWTSSGGPWITPEDSMKRVVWSETVVRGGDVDVTLPQATARFGFYRDIAVVAYPASAEETGEFANPPTLTTSGPASELAKLTDASLETVMMLPAAKPAGGRPWVQLNYAKPFTARSIHLEHHKRDGSAILLSSDDGTNFQRVADLPSDRSGKRDWLCQRTFPAVTARYFRVEFVPSSELVSLKLSASPRAANWLARTAVVTAPDSRLRNIKTDRELKPIPLAAVRVLTARMDAQGRLKTQLPPGAWQVLRFGYTSTGGRNSPSTSAGGGLECDKLSRAALDKHFAAYVGKLAEECGPLAGKSFLFSEIDSYEQGGNEFMFHRYAHQANVHVVPGMTMGQYGSHIDGTQTWWRNAGRAWMKYLQRGQWLLRQGVPVSDALVFVGEGSPHRVPKRDPASPDIPAGYNVDHCDAEVLFNRVRVQDGRLVLPEGTNYAFLVLNNTERMSLKLLHRLRELAQAGATIYGSKPSAPIGYDELRHHRAEFTALAAEIWGDTARPFHRVGQGRVSTQSKLADVFRQSGIAPDFRVADEPHATFIHRRVGDSDVYFFHNSKLETRTLRASFRVQGRLPELWHADTGVIERPAQFTQANGRTELPVTLEPHGSVFVVFRDSAEKFDAVKSVVRVDASSEDSQPLTPSAGERDGVRGGSGWAKVGNEMAARVLLDSNGAMQLAVTGNGEFAVERASGKRQKFVVTKLPAPLEVTGAWQVSFGEMADAPREMAFASLTDWQDSSREDIKHYSGTATYRQTLHVPAEWIGQDRRIYLDLGRVEIAAEVTLNGADLGVSWRPPFVVEVTQQLRPGANELVVKVTNTWRNRLIGDEAFERTDGYASNAGRMVDWYADNQPPPPGPRRTFTTFNFYTKDRELSPAGLLGPVRLLQELRSPLQ